MTDIFLYRYTNTAVGAILSLIRTWEPCWSEQLEGRKKGGVVSNGADDRFKI